MLRAARVRLQCVCLSPCAASRARVQRLNLCRGGLIVSDTHILLARAARTYAHTYTPTQRARRNKTVPPIALECTNANVCRESYRANARHKYMPSAGRMRKKNRIKIMSSIHTQNALRKTGEEGQSGEASRNTCVRERMLLNFDCQ